MKFCGQCGTSMEDSVKFCPACGEPQKENDDPVAAVKNTVLKNRKKLKKYAVIAVAAIVVIFVLVNLFTPGYKKAVKKYFNAYEDKNFSKMFDLYPDFLTETIDKDVMREIQSELKSELSGIKLSYKIIDTDRMDDDEIENIEERFEHYYDEDVNIKKAYQVTVKLTAKMNGESETVKMSVVAMKIGFKWYIYDTSMDL